MKNPVKFFIFPILLSCFISPPPAMADPITELNYQGRIMADSAFFNDTGSFKFLITNSAGNASYWSNDSSSTGGSEPTDAVAIRVRDGLYSVILGDSSITNMTSISPSIFANGNDLYLAVWFDDGTNGSQQLLPNEKIVSAAYAVNSERVRVDDDTLEIGASGVQVRRDYAYEMETYVIKTGGTVGLDCDYTTIQAAIGSNRAIFVKDGTYTENLDLNWVSNLIIRGESRNVVIENTGSGYTIDIRGGSSNIVITDLTCLVSSGGGGLRLNNCSEVKVDGCFFDGSGTGTYAVYSVNGVGNERITIEGCRLQDWSSALIRGEFNYSFIRGNSLLDDSYGIYLEGASRYNMISGNSISDCPYPIYLYSDDAEDNTINGNTIDQSGTASGYGIWLRGADRNSVTGNTVRNQSVGLIVYQTADENTLRGNDVADCNYGCYVYQGTGNTIGGNVFEGNSAYYGMFCYYADDCVFDGNTFRDFNYGSYVYSCDRTSFTANQVNFLTGYGFYLYSCENIVVAGNCIYGPAVGTGAGLYLYSCLESAAGTNAVTNCNQGIYLNNCTDCVVVGNANNGNTDDMLISGGSGNVVANNFSDS